MPDDTEFEKILKLWEQAVKGVQIRRANDYVDLEEYFVRCWLSCKDMWAKSCRKGLPIGDDRDVTFCCYCPQNRFHFCHSFWMIPIWFSSLYRFEKKFYSYIWSGLWWSTTWLRLLHSLETWRGEKAWEEERCKSQKYSQVEDYELLREVEINVLDIEHRTCSISLQDGGESHWPAWCYEWTRGAIV